MICLYNEYRYKELFELKLEPCDTYGFELFDKNFTPNDYESKSKYYLYIFLLSGVNLLFA